MNFAERGFDLTSTDQCELELRELEAEALGWLPLGDRAYLHVPAKLPLAGSATHEEVPTVTVVGNATDALGLGGVVLLVG